MTHDELRDWFSFHEGTEEQRRACIVLRTGMYRLAENFRQMVPPGPGQRHALALAKSAMQAMIGEVVAPQPQ